MNIRNSNRLKLIYNDNMISCNANEQIKEYSLLIDSKDRNYQVYPDPFSYTITIDPVASTKELIGNEYVTFETPTPVILGSIINVKYIRLEEVILPMYNRIWDVRKKDGMFRKEVMTVKPLTENLYTVLTLGSKFEDENYRSTNDVLSKSFSTIYYDCNANATHYFGRISNGIKIYPPNGLIKLDKLNINFMDPYGNPIVCSHLDKNIKSSMICTCDDPEGDLYTTCFKHNLSHPLNPIFQNHLHLKIGVVESFIR